MQVTRHSIELRTRKNVKGYGLLSFVRNLSKKNGKQLFDIGLNVLKTVFKIVDRKAPKATGDL